MLNIALALTASLVAATPAIAAEPSMVPGMSAPSTQPHASGKTQRYCVIDTITGSRIPLKACHSRADWLALGFDPTAK